MSGEVLKPRNVTKAAGTEPDVIHTALHGSHEASQRYCDECQAAFTPRIKDGPNADRFCNSRCKDKWHNVRRRAPLRSPPGRQPMAGGENIEKQTSAHTLTRSNSKLKRVLAALANGESHHRFTAERELHDHCLHSTVSSIQKYGIDVSRKDEVVAGFQGHPTHVMRYWLDEENRKRAAKLLGWRTCLGQL